MSSYSVVLELFDHTAHQPTFAPSPLHPSTRTGLPPALDAELLSKQNLVLPASFWQRLPASRRLDSSASSTTRVTPPSAAPPRVWSESSGSFSPPFIATAALYTPSQAHPSQQTAKLDFRFGPLSIEWVDYPAARAPMSPPLSSSPPLPYVGSSTQRPRALSKPIAEERPPKPPETSGTTQLHWGMIHLYRESGAAGGSSEKEKKAALEADDGTVVGMISVPGNITAAGLLTFIAPALESVAQLRMLRDSTPNRTMVLIRFREAADADEFRRMYNGRSFHDSKESEVCHVVAISSIKLKTSTTPPFTFPYSPSDLDTTPSDLVELPTCPVCLERMDYNVSGLIQILCTHSFHCNCLLKWGDSRCPVCRSTNFRNGARKATLSSHAEPHCAVCQSDSNLWFCIICGNVGCGRYQGGHAHSHYEESHHNFAMELETSRVWAYSSDEYVHRLIRNRADGMLVELPSSSLGKGEEKGDKGGPDRDAEESQDKLEAMGVEYTVMMTGQLELQRGYYEEEIGRRREEIGVLRRKWEESLVEGAKGGKERVQLAKRLEEVVERAERERQELKMRLEGAGKVKAEDEARRKKERGEAVKARKEVDKQLEAERAVTASLTENLGHLKMEIAKRDSETKELRVEIDDLRDQMRDVMFALSARDKIEEQGGEMEGGSVSVPAPTPTPTPTPSARRKKKR